MSEDQDLSNTEAYYGIKVCTADWIDGLSIDIIDYSEIGGLTGEQLDMLWSKYTDISLIKSCDDCFMVKTGEFDEIPGQSTEFFSIMTDDEKQLKAQIRDLILDAIKRPNDR